MIYLNNFIPIRVYYSESLNLYRLETCKADIDRLEFNETFIRNELSSYQLQTTLYGINPRVFPPVPLGTSMFEIFQNDKPPYETQRVKWVAFPIMTTVSAQLGEFSVFSFITNPGGSDVVPVFIRNEERNVKITFDKTLIDQYFLNTPYDQKALDRDNFVVYLFKKPCLFWRPTTEALCVPSNNPKDFSTLISCQRQTYPLLKNYKSYTGNSGIPLSWLKSQVFPWTSSEKGEGKGLFFFTLFLFLLLCVLTGLKMWSLRKKMNTQQKSPQKVNVIGTQPVFFRQTKNLGIKQ